MPLARSLSLRMPLPLTRSSSSSTSSGSINIKHPRYEDNNHGHEIYPSLKSTNTATKAGPGMMRRFHSLMTGQSDPWSDIPVSSSLTPGHARLLTHVLSLPVTTTPLLTTRCAALPPPLTRGELSPWPRDLCEVHTWLAPRFLHRVCDLVSGELWEWSEVLYSFPREYLGRYVEGLLYGTLMPIRLAFRPIVEKEKDDGKVKMIKQPLDAFVARSVCYLDGTCVACKLNQIFTDPRVVRALALLCKGRKRTGAAWPELLAFIDPVEYGEDPKWRSQWLSEGVEVRRARRRAKIWRECDGHGHEGKNGQGWQVKQYDEVKMVNGGQEKCATEMIVGDYAEEKRWDRTSFRERVNSMQQRT